MVNGPFVRQKLESDQASKTAAKMWEKTGLTELSMFQSHVNKITMYEFQDTGGGKPL